MTKRGSGMNTGRLNRKYIWIAVYLALGALAALSLVQGCRNALTYSQDFQWDAAKALFLGINPYRESLSPSGALDAYGFEAYFSTMEANQFPSLLMLLYPYTLLAPMTARVAWLLSNLGFTALMAFGLRKTFLREAPANVFYAIMLLMLAGTPWRNQIGVGQHTIFSMAFFLLAVWFAENEKKDGSAMLPGWAAFCLSVLCLCVCYFKYTLTVPLVLYFVYKKYWKEIFVSAGIHVLATFWAAWHLKAGFFDMIILPLRVSSALSGEGSIDVSVLLQGSPAAFAVSGGLFLLLFFIVLRMPEGNEALVITLLTLISLIITYHRSYDFFVLIVPFGYFLSQGGKPLADGRKWLFLAYAVLLLGVFFGLRLFHESKASLLCVGTLYYLFTLCFLGLSLYPGRRRERL